MSVQLKMLRRSWSHAVKCVAFLGLASLTAADAEAGYTRVNATTPGAELGHADILSHAYGGTFAGDGGVNFANGSLTAMRCDDFGGAASDQCWDGSVVSARVLARFAGYEQSLGVLDGASGGSFRKLFSVSGTGLDVAGSASGPGLGGNGNGGTFRFARGGGGNVLTSFQLDNLEAADQMVSYRLDGTPPGGGRKFVLFFEDLGPGEGSDWDYNDLVVEVTTAPLATAIPLPPAVWTGLMVLLSGGLWNARGALRRWLVS